MKDGRMSKSEMERKILFLCNIIDAILRRQNEIEDMRKGSVYGHKKSVGTKEGRRNRKLGGTD
jgi:hypothetical protein